MQSNGRPSLAAIMQQWNKVLQKQHGGFINGAPQKPLTLTPASGADLLAPMEAPPSTPEKGKAMPVMSNQQQPTKRPVIEIIPPPSILNSRAGSVLGTPPKAGAMSQQNLLSPPGQPLMLEGPPTPALSESTRDPALLAAAGVTAPLDGSPALAGSQAQNEPPVVPAMGPTGVPAPGVLQTLGGSPAAVGSEPMGVSTALVLAQPQGPPPSLDGFDSLGMAPFVASSQPSAGFSDLDSFKALGAPTSQSGSQGLTQSFPASGFMALTPGATFPPAPAPSIAPPAATPASVAPPSPANGNNELISLS